MVDLKIINADLFTAKTESIIITFGGTGKGFRVNVPEEFIKLQSSIPYPIPMGSIYTSRPEKSFPYKALFLGSVLHHQSAPNRWKTLNEEIENN